MGADDDAALREGKMSGAQLRHGDCLQVMRNLLAEGVQFDALITDPPYHFGSIVERWSKTGGGDRKESPVGAYGRHAKGFMGKEWDGGDIAFRSATWQLALMLLKPGGHILAFGGTKGWHRLACAIEDAGAEIRDTVAWIYGSGFPKSFNQAKAIDGLLGAEGQRAPKGGEVRRIKPGADQHAEGSWEKLADRTYQPHDYQPATDEALQWGGWGTALKPAFEPIIIAQRPVSEASIAANALAHGVGPINIDACRVAVEDQDYERNCSGRRGHDENRERKMDFGMTAGKGSDKGRWPANVVHDGSPEVLDLFALYGADKGAIAPVTKRGADKFRNTYGDFAGQEEVGATFRGDTGTAARFFYCAKANATDRAGSKHPTVKPVALMRWLVRMVTPPNGLILDPFAGSGTTGAAALAEGARAILIEAEGEYVADIRRRLVL